MWKAFAFFFTVVIYPLGTEKRNICHKQVSTLLAVNKVGKYNSTNIAIPAGPIKKIGFQRPKWGPYWPV